MIRMLTVSLVCVVALTPTLSSAGVPFPPLSTCNLTIAQFPTRTQCLALVPPVIRLCPDAQAVPAFDALSITVRVRWAGGGPVNAALVAFSELSGTVNIATGGSTTAVTGADGLATVSLTRASGYGRVALCADGVRLCNVEIRSPDVATTATPTGCSLPTTGTSFVNGADLLNPECGCLSQFGPVTTGVNEGWDLNCDGLVNALDVNGSLGRGGFLQHYGHGGSLGATYNCDLP